MGGLGSESNDRPLHCCLTGFGPFSRSQHNPSWLAARELDGLVLSDPPLPDPEPYSSRLSRRRAIRVSAHEVPTVWNSILNLIPTFHGLDPSTIPPETEAVEETGSLSPVYDYDFFVHVGLGGNGHVAVETLAHQYGYRGVDWKGNPPPFTKTKEGKQTGFVTEEWAGLTDDDGTLRPIVKCQELRDWVAKTVGTEKIIISSDAGSYCCEFMFFASMACALRCSKGEGAERPQGTHKPVIFVHVPSIGEPFDLHDLTRIIEAVIRGIANEIQS